MTQSLKSCIISLNLSRQDYLRRTIFLCAPFLLSKMYQPNPQEREALNIILNEKKSWEEGAVWVTDRDQMLMRNIVKKARNNFFGIYKNPNDPITGRKKIFVPFTEWTISKVLSNIDLDTKDIETIARHPGAYRIAAMLRYVLNYYFDKIHLNETINNMLFCTALDGTALVKTWKEGKEIKQKVVDRLNVICDPSAPSLVESSGVIERNVLNMYEFDQYEGWENKDYVEGDTNIDRMGLGLELMNKNQKTEIPYVEMWERWGYFPKYILSGNPGDKKKYTYGMMVASGIQSKNPILHLLAEKEPEDIPYQDFHFQRIPNRFDGRGVPERTFSIQAYLNEIVNARLNVSRISQSKLWSLKGNITPQKFSKMFQTHAIKLGANDEIQLLDTGMVDPSSYKDEEQAYTWGQRVTNTMYEDEVPASKPATNALIQERSTSKANDLIMENIGLAMERMIKRQLIPLIKQVVKDGEMVRLSGDKSALEQMDEDLTDNLINQMLNDSKKKLGYPSLNGVEMVQDPMQVEAFKQNTLNELKKQGSVRYAELRKEMFNTDFDVKVNVGNHDINKGAALAALNQITNILAGAGLPIKEPVKKVFDLLGENGEQMTRDMPDAPPQPQGVPAQGEIPSESMIPRAEMQASNAVA